MSEKSPTEFDGENSAEILTLAGMALYQAQIFEVAVTNLAVGLFVSKRTGLRREDVDTMFDRLEQDTLGRILTEVRKYQHLDEATEHRLKGLLGLRNKLIHGFFRGHNANFMDARGRKIMAVELHQMINELFRGHMDVEQMYAPLWAALGFTEEWMEVQLEQMREEGRSELADER